jgi:hypothetical protein
MLRKQVKVMKKNAKEPKSEIGQDIEWDGDVTVEIIIEYMASQFPELVLAIAEENFIRGYRQALLDVEASERNENEQKQA